MPDSKKTFVSGDKVLAKLKGYPPWPSRIIAVADESSKCRKYHVYFYGSHQTAVVKEIDVCSYLENRGLITTKKQRLFSLAVKEIDAELSDMNIDLNVESPIAGNVHNDNTEPSGENSSNNTIDTQPTNTSGVSIEKSEIKRKYRAMPPVATNSDGDRLPVKKKKFRAAPSTITPTLPPSICLAASERTSSADAASNGSELSSAETIQDKEGSSNIGNDTLTACDKRGKELTIPLKLNRPRFANRDSERAWDKMVLEFARSLKNRLEAGEKLYDIGEIMDESTPLECSDYIELSRIRPFGRVTPEKLEMYKTVARVLDIDLEIRKALNRKKARPLRCIYLLKALDELKLTPLVLKKHPDVVYTLRKLRNYVGNTAQWKLSARKLQKFNESAKKIRENATMLYNKIKSMFNSLQKDRPFQVNFMVEVKLFQEKVSSMSSEEILSLTEDP